MKVLIEVQCSTVEIKSIGPRYCPSIEDKINRFADKERHQLFVEPEGWTTCEYYINGFSTSLPEDVQFKALRSVAGFENVKFLDQVMLLNTITSLYTIATYFRNKVSRRFVFCWTN